MSKTPEQGARHYRRQGDAPQRIKDLEEAVRFYAEQWVDDPDVETIGPTPFDQVCHGITTEPSEALMEDAGRRAREVLAGQVSPPTDRDQMIRLLREADALTEDMETDAELDPEHRVCVAQWRKELRELLGRDHG